MDNPDPPVASHPLAYKDAGFLDSDDARPLRILAEYIEPMRRFRQEGITGTIVFFGSARLTATGPLGRYYEDARSLAHQLTTWSQALPPELGRVVVCSGGGNGIMEAANRGATEAGGRTIGLNISLPEEQSANSYISPELSFEFRYFFMRKLWFAHLARAIVVFPGGFGTLDELTEMLTLAQTHKLDRRIVIVLYGTSYWKEILNFEALVRHGVISPEDLSLFQFADDPAAATGILREAITPDLRVSARTPSFARSRMSRVANDWIYVRSGD